VLPVAIMLRIFIVDPSSSARSPVFAARIVGTTESLTEPLSGPGHVGIRNR
jgi:hypothetical protein